MHMNRLTRLNPLSLLLSSKTTTKGMGLEESATKEDLVELDSSLTS